MNVTVRQTIPITRPVSRMSEKTKPQRIRSPLYRPVDASRYSRSSNSFRTTASCGGIGRAFPFGETTTARSTHHGIITPRCHREDRSTTYSGYTASPVIRSITTVPEAMPGSLARPVDSSTTFPYTVPSTVSASRNDRTNTTTTTTPMRNTQANRVSIFIPNIPISADYDKLPRNVFNSERVLLTPLSRCTVSTNLWYQTVRGFIQYSRARPDAPHCFRPRTSSSVSSRKGFTGGRARAVISPFESLAKYPIWLHGHPAHGPVARRGWTNDQHRNPPA